MPTAPDRTARPLRSHTAPPHGPSAPVIDLRDGARGHLRPVPTPASEVPLGPSAPVPAVPSATAVQFSESVRRVVAVARRHGLRAPVFRSPPRLAQVDRTIRRRPSGQVVVAVRRSGRPLSAVRADIIDGVVAANGLEGAAADRFRHEAWAGLEPVQAPPRRVGGSDPANRPAAPGRGARSARVA